MDWSVVFHPAATAIIGSILGASTVLLSQHFERKQRKREAIFKVATELALDRMRAIAMQQGLRKENDEIVWLSEYFRLATYLFEHGKLPPEVITDRMVGSQALR
jgi:hypothetical protein